MKIDVTEKYHPVNCDTFAAYMDHELGHALDRLAAGGAQADFGFSQAGWFKDIAAKNAAEMKELLSQYALKRYNWAPSKPIEMIAEAWSEYLNNPNARGLATEIAEKMLEILGGTT